MQTTGKIIGAGRSFDGKNLTVTFELESSASGQLEQLTKHEKLSIKAVRYREKRSLDANSYAWVLMSKIADAVCSSKEEIYEEMLQKYGSVYEDDDGYITVTVKNTVDMSKIHGHWKYIKDNGTFKSYLMLKGSSEYDTAEMSRFIDRIIDEAEALNIETATPEEIERMKQEWGV